MSLRGPKSAHRSAAEAAMARAREHLQRGLSAIQRGRCTSAYMSLTEMWEELGKAEAEGRWAGEAPWKPTTDIQELGFQFSQRCLRDEPVTLEGARRRRVRRRRTAR